MGKLTLIVCAVLALFHGGLSSADDKASDTVLKDKGLTKVGITYLLEGDIKLPETLRAMPGEEDSR